MDFNACVEFLNVHCRALGELLLCRTQILLPFVNSHVEPRVLYSKSKCGEYVCQCCLHIFQSAS